MHSVADARAAVLAALAPRPAVAVPIARAGGLCLTAPARAPGDSPPFAKATMDGYAVRSADCARPPVTLRVMEEVPAGAVPTRPVESGTCVKIMTGAPLPDGADAVVPVEQARRDGDRVTLSPPAPPTAGAAVLARGAAVRAGDVLVPAGRPLSPAAVGLLAEAGFDPVRVVPRPRVAVLSTGDEVVPANETPGPGRIRDANAPLLIAALAAAGAGPVPLGHAPDDRAALTEKVRAGLKEDALLISGGVSAGDYDLVPGVLADCGVRRVFHGVNVKPGKPLWFGIAEGPERRGGRVRIAGEPGQFADGVRAVRPPGPAAAGRPGGVRPPGPLRDADGGGGEPRRPPAVPPGPPDGRPGGAARGADAVGRFRRPPRRRRRDRRRPDPRRRDPHGGRPRRGGAVGRGGVSEPPGGAVPWRSPSRIGYRALGARLRMTFARGGRGCPRESC